MKFNIVTIFPNELMRSLNYGVIGNAINDNKIRIDCHDPRIHADNKHNSIDDKPYGGGPGMVMQAEPVLKSIQQARNGDINIPVVFLSPQGKTFNQDKAKELSKLDEIIIVSSRYEGLDQRAIDQTDNHEELSIGEYILSGGETACAVVIDSISRLIPGVLGDRESILEESFSDGLLEYPHYTRPPEVNGDKVPEILLSGDHQKINQWRRVQSLRNTYLKRPDLIDRSNLSEDEIEIIDAIKNDPE
ncbi:MAG: tRNA (guanosine(37)-N1)-methyltransferase TrmD [Gammaproteobacteria bacterium]|nr:tRNA (guanosine(37)-N1)-methyltransferase TrmD [Gammaproteobacteria bacterium]